MSQTKLKIPYFDSLAWLSYAGMALISLGLLILFNLFQDRLIICLFLLIIGLSGVFLRFQSAPVLLILALALGEYLQRAFYGRFLSNFGSVPFMDTEYILPTAALLGYVVAQYRLISFTQSIIPSEVSRPLASGSQGTLKTKRPEKEFRRPINTFDPSQLLLFLFTIPLFVVLGNWVAMLLARIPRRGFGLPPQFSRLLLFCAGFSLVILVFHSLITYFRWQRMSKKQAIMLLQDMEWQQLRGELRHIYVSLEIDKIRQRKKEGNT